MNTTMSPSPARVTLRARDIAELAVASGYPCISVLMPTESAPRMTASDLHRLQLLVAEVDLRLHEHRVLRREPLMQKLAEEVRRAAVGPTGQALAIYVSQAVNRRFRLPQPVVPRAVVEGTFATRPLVSALHRTPPHVVLMLSEAGGHLYAAADGGLRPTRRLDRYPAAAHGRPPGGGGAITSAVPGGLTDAFLQGVDRMLGEYRAEHPSPLVLAGPGHLLDRFAALSHNLERLAGRLPAEELPTGLDLARASAEAVEAYLHGRRAEALRELERASRERPGDVASGIDRCWQAARSRRPALLLVEESYVVPGVPPQRSGATVVLGEEQWQPGEVHDLVDDLMEQVILTGGQLALVEDGDLGEHERVALISRR